MIEEHLVSALTERGVALGDDPDEALAEALAEALDDTELTAVLAESAAEDTGQPEPAGPDRDGRVAAAVRAVVPMLVESAVAEAVLAETAIGFPLPATAARWARRPPPVPREVRQLTARPADLDWIRVA